MREDHSKEMHLIAIGHQILKVWPAKFLRDRSGETRLLCDYPSLLESQTLTC